MPNSLFAVSGLSIKKGKIILSMVWFIMPAMPKMSKGNE